MRNKTELGISPASTSREGKVKTERGKGSDNLCKLGADPEATIYTTSEDLTKVFTSSSTPPRDYAPKNRNIQPEKLKPEKHKPPTNTS